MSDENEIPATEHARRRRVASCTEDLADFIKDARDRIRELTADLDVPMRDVIQMLPDEVKVEVAALAAHYFPTAPEPDPTLPPPLDPWHRHGLVGVIHRLFDEAPKLAAGEGRPEQSPAFECHVVLKAGVTMAGALSTTPEGTLRLLSMNQVKGPRGPEMVMIEHFFEWDQVADIAVQRDVKAHAREPEAPRIIT